MDSSSRPIRKFAVSVSAIGAALAIFPALNSHPSWADESISRLPAVEVLRRRAFDPNPPDRKIILNQSRAGKTLPLWQRTVTALGKNYPVMMVGKDPRKPLADPTTAVKTVIVPVRLTMPAESPSDPPLAFDPTSRDPKCSPAGKPIDLTLASPVFKPMTVDKLGTAQLGTLYQRANLNELTSGGGPNPNYTIVLNPVTAPKQIIDDEKNDVGAAWRTAKCGLRASVNILKLTRHIEKVLFPQLRKNGVNPQVLPIFLFYNTSFRDDEREGTYGGFHDFFWNNSVFQTYIVASFDTSFDRTKPYQDVYVLAHEVAEWMADPDIYNPTPPWGPIGDPPSGPTCYPYLEVADPFDIAFNIPMPNGYTYHVPDLAFMSWFYRIAGPRWHEDYYSLFGTFRTLPETWILSPNSPFIYERAGALNFSLKRTGCLQNPATVFANTLHLQGPHRYISLSDKTVTFKSEEGEKTIPIKLQDNWVLDFTVTEFYLKLTSKAGYTPDAGLAETLTYIMEDDPALHDIGTIPRLTETVEVRVERDALGDRPAMTAYVSTAETEGSVNEGNFVSISNYRVSWKTGETMTKFPLTILKNSPTAKTFAITLTYKGSQVDKKTFVLPADDPAVGSLRMR